MPHQAQVPVVILYEHPLLGEGIAKYLRAETGVATTLVRADDLDAVRAVLARNPAVLIFERTGPLRDVDLAALAPHAVLFDVTAAVCPESAGSGPPARFEQIRHAVARDNRPPVVPSR